MPVCNCSQDNHSLISHCFNQCMLYLYLCTQSVYVGSAEYKSETMAKLESDKDGKSICWICLSVYVKFYVSNFTAFFLISLYLVCFFHVCVYCDMSAVCICMCLSTCLSACCRHTRHVCLSQAARLRRRRLPQVCTLTSYRAPRTREDLDSPFLYTLYIHYINKC